MTNDELKVQRKALEKKRFYSSPVLKSFGDWYDLTLGGGAVVAADPGGGNTKTGR